jgi:hypothetical protein
MLLFIFGLPIHHLFYLQIKVYKFMGKTRIEVPRRKEMRKRCCYYCR